MDLIEAKKTDTFNACDRWVITMLNHRKKKIRYHNVPAHNLYSINCDNKVTIPNGSSNS